MSRAIREGKSLICGCCGQYFRTWKGYKDQDQDVGYGTCASCQESIEEKNTLEYEKMWNTLIGGVSEETKKNMLHLIENKGWTKVMMVNMALEKGWLTWKINRAS